MLRSRVLISALALACGLTLSGIASADVYPYEPVDGGSVSVMPGAYVTCGKMGGRHCYRHYRHHAMCGMCRVHRLTYSCTAYELSVNPIHTDRVCTQWVWNKPCYYK